MNKKMGLAGLVAGVVMFFWSFIAHDVLPTGQAGLSTTANEDEVLAALKIQITQPGMYFMPGANMMRSKSGTNEERQAAMDAWQKQLAAGPRALLIYHPRGAQMLDPKMLGNEFLSDIVAGLIVTWMFVMALPNLRTFASRILYVTFAGLLGWVIVDFSYWNWFEFPTAYALAQIADYVVGALLAGVFLAWFYRKNGTQEVLAKAA